MKFRHGILVVTIKMNNYSPNVTSSVWSSRRGVTADNLENSADRRNVGMDDVRLV